MEPDWTFRIEDENARYSIPPDEVRVPLEAAVAKLREATEACRTAALELGAEIRTSSQAGYGVGWILETSNLNSGDLERVLRGEELF
ncbi:hypothetical protein GA0061083_2705 [Pseudarthrobacter enclensis]|uniref:Antitoxin HicB n=1 Tax=Pseudarthrobacter enclensis TaxID=993070 RepID=A0A0V8IMT4_9MICC|nr:hypothetical protein [Pseudarthrobacter enclensis]KSU76058.1 hypothetical protein AS031_11865 [Pseudarthrobacter enclensis]SCC10908.1 hypothetical protein GA0061083_2705 [Pseudarthrobacter enclensis]